jgi:hypothetical protein
MVSPIVRHARSRARLALGGLLAIALASGCSGVDGQLSVTGTVLGDTVLEPDRCDWAAWDDYESVLLTSSQPDWEIDVVSWGRHTDVDLMVWGRAIAVGECELFDAVINVDEDDARGHLRMSCSLIAGGSVEGEIYFRGC